MSNVKSWPPNDCVSQPVPCMCKTAYLFRDFYHMHLSSVVVVGRVSSADHRRHVPRDDESIQQRVEALGLYMDFGVSSVGAQTVMGIPA